MPSTSSCTRGVSFAEQTKYLDEALHADARHEHVSPPLLSAKIRNDMLRSFLAPGPATRVVDLGLRQRADARLERRPRRAAQVGIDVSPFFAREACERADLVLGDLRRLPFGDGVFTKACGARRLRAPLARGARRRAARSRARAAARRPAVRLQPRAQELARSPAACEQINRLARWLERARPRRPGRGNACASRTTSTRSRTSPTSSAWSATAGFRIERIRYYTPLIGGFVENILVRIGEHWLASRAARQAAAAGRALDGNDAAREARAAAKARVGRRGPAYAALRLRHVGDEARPRCSSAACARARSSPCSVRGRRERPPMRILYAALDQRVPGTTGGSVHVTAVAEGLAALGHEVARADDAGPRAVSRTGVPAGTRWRRRSACATCASLRGRGGPRVRPTGPAPTSIIERYHNFGGEGCARRSAIGARGRARGQRAGHRLSRARRRRGSTGAARRAHAPLARLAVPRWPTSSSRRPRRSCRRIRAARADRRDRVGRRHRRGSRPDAAGPVPFARRPGALVAVFAGAFRAWHGAVTLVRAMRDAAGARARATSRPCSSATARSWRGRKAEADGHRRRHVHRRRAARADAGLPGGRRHRRRAVRRRRPTRRCSSPSTGRR